MEQRNSKISFFKGDERDEASEKPLREGLPGPDGGLPIKLPKAAGV